jgi:hypothetical protein
MAYTPEVLMNQQTDNAIVGIKALFTALVIGSVIGMLNGCSYLFDTTPSYPVKSSGLIFGLRFGPDPIYWLDNERALFPAYANERRIGPGSKEDWAPPGLFIWDTKNNTYKRHADLQDGPWVLRFNNGFLCYSIDGDKGGEQKVIKAGRFGEEKLLPQDRPWKLHPELAQCREPEAEIRPEHQGAAVKRLRPEEGYIYIGRREKEGGKVIGAHNQNDLVKFYRTGQAEPIELPILAKELGTSAVVSYSEYAGKYVIQPHTWRGGDVLRSVTTWPRGTRFPVYLLSRDGKVETIEIPYGTWDPIRVFVTRRGLFWISNNAPSANSKQAGGWLLHQGKMTKQFDHLVAAAGVSPDGCKIAYAINDFNRKTREYVQVIELCK